MGIIPSIRCLIIPSNQLYSCIVYVIDLGPTIILTPRQSVYVRACERARVCACVCLVLCVSALWGGGHASVLSTVCRASWMGPDTNSDGSNCQ